MDYIDGLFAVTLIVLAYVGLLVWAAFEATRPLDEPKVFDDYSKRAEAKSFRLQPKDDIDTNNPEFMEELDRIMSRDAGIPEIYIRKS